MKLYSYWRSVTAYRVRIALNLKGVDAEIIPVDIMDGAQRDDDFVALNPAMGVPVLLLDDGTVLSQSMAIIDWLDSAYPEPAFLPENPIGRSLVNAATQVITTDVHPVNNLRVVQRLELMGHSKDEITDWMLHWMTEGLRGFQSMILPDTPFAFGNAPGLADICLVAQLYNGRRWGLNMTPFERVSEIEANCLELEPFLNAQPEKQPDTPPKGPPKLDA